MAAQTLHKLVSSLGITNATHVETVTSVLASSGNKTIQLWDASNVDGALEQLHGRTVKISIHVHSTFKPYTPLSSRMLWLHRCLQRFKNVRAYVLHPGGESIPSLMHVKSLEAIVSLCCVGAVVVAVTGTDHVIELPM